MEALKINEGLAVCMEKLRGQLDKLPLIGTYKVELVRDGEVVHSEEGFNTITIEGKNKMLDVAFHNTTQIATWYIGLVDNSGAGAFAEAHTYAGIGGTNGWNEFVSYTEGTRGEWTEGAASSKSITNSTAVTFSINASGTVKGICLVGGGTNASGKADNAGGGTMWTEAAFTSPVSVANGDSLKITYTINS
ncbi:MAG: hypothetical protein AMXMBFR16_10340 [Candidatus Uhrbacteria bacterium]